MFCYNCGAKLVESAKFCSECGAKQPSIDNPIKVEKPGVTVGGYSSKIKAESIGKNYQVCGNKKVHFDDEMLDYIELRKPFEENASTLQRKFEKFYYDKINSFDDVVTVAFPEWKKYMNTSVNLAVDTLLDKSIDYIDQDELWEKLEDSLDEVVKEIGKNIAIVEAYKKELNEADDAGGPWVGGGFGVTGAIKGAVQAELLNAGTSLVGGLVKNITGNTNEDKIRKLKEKIYEDMDADEVLSSSLYDMSREVFYYVYDILVNEGVISSVSLYPDKAKGKYNNFVRGCDTGRYTGEQGIEILCECIEYFPYEMAYFLSLDILIPDKCKKNLDDLARDLGLLIEYQTLQKGQNAEQRENDIQEKMRMFNIPEDCINRILENPDIMPVVMDQSELDEALAEITGNESRQVILLDNKFNIPLDKENITYAGIGYVKASFNTNTVIDFKALGIGFKDVEFDRKYNNLVKSEDILHEGIEALQQEKYREAMEFLHQASKLGNGDAACYLGWMYKEGIGGAKNKEKAAKYTDMGIKSADGALFVIGKAYKYGLYGCRHDYGEAVEYLSESARPEAMCELGEMYAIGRGVSKDLQKAQYWYGRAASLGNYDAEYEYAVISKDLGEEDGLWDRIQEAANHGVAKAIYTLARAHEYGVFKENDSERVEQMLSGYKLAAQKKHPDALCRLGQIYMEGQIVPKSMRIAVDYLKKAIDAGSIEANVELGVCYANGDGVEQNYTKAVELYEDAAEYGDNEALYNLGMCYYYGAGVDKDENKAKELYLQSAHKGNDEAKQTLAEVFGIEEI